MDRREYALATRAYEALRMTPPASGSDLRNYLKVFLGMDIPCKRMCEGHSSPMEYLCHAFFEGRRSGGDAVIWAGRGGGKTMLGAVVRRCATRPGPAATT